jgi:NADPH-dependent 2,4-dienoyl-CoA reductase/sulfur reductase-like enzyme
MSRPAAVVVVGASLAGATAALTLRERGFDGGSAEAYEQHRLTLLLGTPPSHRRDRRTLRLSGEVLPYTHLILATGVGSTSGRRSPAWTGTGWRSSCVPVGSPPYWRQQRQGAASRPAPHRTRRRRRSAG